jgi:hypothetical protein
VLSFLFINPLLIQAAQIQGVAIAAILIVKLGALVTANIIAIKER